MSEEKKVEKKAPKKEVKILPPKANEEIFRVGEEVEVSKTKFIVKQIKGVDLILARKDYR